MQLSATSAALLGLLSLRRWTTYELAQQAQRSLRWFLPRAERHLYGEAKRLAAAGLATADVGHTGRRRATTYAITPAGRDALRAWLRDEPAPPVLEFEALLRTFFADAGTREDLLATLEATRAQAADALDRLAGMAAQTVSGDAEFLDRVGVNGLAMRFGADFHRLVEEWATWALAEVATWEHADGRGWEGGMEVFRDVAARRGAGGAWGPVGAGAGGEA